MEGEENWHWNRPPSFRITPPIANLEVREWTKASTIHFKEPWGGPYIRRWGCCRPRAEQWATILFKARWVSLDVNRIGREGDVPSCDPPPKSQENHLLGVGDWVGLAIENSIVQFLPYQPHYNEEDGNPNFFEEFVGERWVPFIKSISNVMGMNPFTLPKMKPKIP